MLVALIILFSLTTIDARATEGFCGISWGSLDKRVEAFTSDPVTGARAGRHECYDRLVLDFSGDAPGYLVRYVDHVRQPGSGAIVPVAGGARLQITAQAPAYDEGGHPSVPWRGGDTLVDLSRLPSLPSGFTTFRDTRFAGSYEGYSDYGLGVRARLPFRVLRLDGPGDGSRLVIDVAHYW
jgi:hypothetical protein